eukprot:scaffold9972_cov118-Isochrysis_galbana.AAC.12
MPALAPATMPRAAASSYPVVPMIWPARYRPSQLETSSVLRRQRGSTKSYSTSYAGLRISARSSPFIERTISSCTSGGKADEMPLGYTQSLDSPSGSSQTMCPSRSGKRSTFEKSDGQ